MLPWVDKKLCEWALNGFQFSGNDQRDWYKNQFAFRQLDGDTARPPLPSQAGSAFYLCFFLKSVTQNDDEQVNAHRVNLCLLVDLVFDIECPVCVQSISFKFMFSY